jgi:hypothetical protein
MPASPCCDIWGHASNVQLELLQQFFHTSLFRRACAAGAILHSIENNEYKLWQRAGGPVPPSQHNNAHTALLSSTPSSTSTSASSSELLAELG